MVLLEVLNRNHDKLIWRRGFGGSAIWGSPENGRKGGRQLLHIGDIGKYNSDLVIMMARQRRVTEEDDEDTDPGLTDPFLQVGLAIMLPGNPQKSCHHAAWWSSNLQGEEDSIVAVNGHIKQVNIDSPMNLTKLRILSFFVGLFSVCLLFRSFSEWYFTRKTFTTHHSSIHCWETHDRSVFVVDFVLSKGLQTSMEPSTALKIGVEFDMKEETGRIY